MRDLPEWIEVGRVLRPHGVRGEVKVRIESDIDDRFAVGRILNAELAGTRQRLEITGSRPHDGAQLLRFAGVDDRDAAEALRDASLVVPRSEVPTAPDGRWYLWQLVGCRCVDQTAGDLGTVEDVIEDGGGHLLVIGGDGRLLVPFVEAMCTEVDVEAGRITLDLPPGLIEACRSPADKPAAPR